MTGEEWVLAVLVFALGYAAPIFMFTSSSLHLWRGSQAKVRDVIVSLLTALGVFSTFAGVYGILADDEAGQMAAAFYGLFFGSWIHLIALVVWVTCLGARARILAMPEAVGAALSGFALAVFALA